MTITEKSGHNPKSPVGKMELKNAEPLLTIEESARLNNAVKSEPANLTYTIDGAEVVAQQLEEKTE